MTNPTPNTAIVVAAFGKTLLIENHQQQLLKAKTAKRRLGAVCGDRVEYQLSPDGEASVKALLPRETLLERGDFRGRPKPLAANVNQMLVAVAPEPVPQPLLIDRCLIGAQLAGIEASIVRTKADIASPECDALLATYAALGHTVVTVQQDNFDALLPILRNHSSMLIGASGVGKSSLVNSLIPDAKLRVGAISDASGEGKHTTTSSRLFRLEGGGSLIDSPGIRDFQPPTLPANELAHCFREFQPHIGHCRFANCAHQHEPNCAIINSVESGEISQRRYQSYLALLSAPKTY